MEYGSVGDRILIAAVIIGVLAFFTLIRPRNPRKERAEMIGTLLDETKLNIILVDTFDTQPQQWRFHVTGWQIHRKKIEFLDKELIKDIDTAFGMAYEFNQRLKIVKKAKSTKRVTVDIENLTIILPRIKQGLEDWLLANIGTTEHHSQPPGIADWLFGRK